MTIEQTIQKAIEGGYSEFILPEDDARRLRGAQVLLDQNFWQALGKAMGWEPAHDISRYNPIHKMTEPQWKQEWHSFIDHLAENGTIENYFKQIN